MYRRNWCWRRCHQKEVEKERNKIMGGRIQRSEAVHIDS